ncbi:DUF6339 family protein [Mesorhizobium sp. B2-3-12]|uniref:DUF6339 family protein n=1 Tax=Mesorhizobium sp. B2-3-12 TaxID=2589952 RepID=UPI00112B32C0|nr:DUF6339 family protein [Mesorhizobium sp. B2-3-12]TPL93813.1 hypothetical protein FJ948_08120 [Mesorhizobium sp. B2-3-12]
MPYPILSKAEARSYLVVEEGADKPPVPIARLADGGPDLDWTSIAEGIAAALLALADKHMTDKGKVDGSDFEAAASEEIHERMPSHPALADPEFWIWLAVTHCEEIVDRRYAGSQNAKNFGIGGAGENLLYRLWLRAEIAYDASAKDRYALSRFGDIDFWRSHIFRQGYADARGFARALLEFQFPAQAQRKPKLKILEIRALAKHLKRARSNLMFEVMSEARAVEFIESEWGRLALTSG